jgi:hypothetical protein
MPPRKTTVPAPLVSPVVDPHRFAQCRAMGHEWRHKGPVGKDDKRPFNMYEAAGLVSICPDCKTRRVKWITRSGEVITRYEYPDGYSLHGEDRLTTKEWRSSFVVTLFSAGEAGVA